MVRLRSNAAGLQEHLDREREACIRRALERAGGDKERAARSLGISRATRYRELRRFPAGRAAPP